MAEDIRVLLIEPLTEPRLVTIEHTLENLQKLVGGDIQAVYPWEDCVGLVCSDEGKLLGYPANRLLCDEDGKAYDVLCGSFFICGLGREDFCSISDEMAEKYTQKFQHPEMFIRTARNKVLCFKLGSGEPPLEISY